MGSVESSPVDPVDAAELVDSKLEGVAQQKKVTVSFAPSLEESTTDESDDSPCDSPPAFGLERRGIRRDITQGTVWRRQSSSVMWINAPVMQHASFPDEIEGTALTVRMQNLKPPLGITQENDPSLRLAVLLWRERKQDAALSILKDISGEKALAAKHLAVNIGQMHDLLDVVNENIKEILLANPFNPHALFVKSLYEMAQGQDCAYQVTSRKLRSVSPQAYAALDRTVNDVVLAWDSRNFPPCTPETLPKGWRPADLAIVVFGCPVNPDKTPTPALYARLVATLALSKEFPGATIIASGGAVQSEYSESEFIRDWLVAHNVCPARIAVDTAARDTLGNAMFIAEWLRETKVGTVMLVTSTWHSPRSRLNLQGALEARGVNASILSVGAGNSGFQEGPELEQRLALERTASYRDCARARGLFDQFDF
jgi:uncharacterized SAM-binding protein YcdF (DUF218 family)